MPLKFYGNDDTDPGEWFTWRESDEEKVEAQIRRIPPARERAIEFRHFGRKRQVTFSRKGAVQDLDVSKQDEVNKEKAAYCLVDTRGFEVELAGAGAASQIGAALGNGNLAPGEVVKLDGKWTEPLKAVIFEGLPSFVDWIAERAAALNKRDRDEDEEALGN